jgi:3-oxoadipate enol-lactonase
VNRETQGEWFSRFSVPELPPGRSVDLPGRGTTWVLDMAGPRRAPAVVLLHGWTATAGLNWFPAFGSLAKHFRVVALDHRGHGRGIRSRTPFRLEDCADDAAALADVLGISKMIAVGYSMGGPVAQLLWRRHGDRVEGMVLCATAASFHRGDQMNLAFALLPGMMPGLTLAAALVPPAVRRRLLGKFLSKRVTDPAIHRWIIEEIGRNDPAAMLEAGHAIIRFSSSRWIEEVNVPTAVIVTQQDALVPPERQMILVNGIPGASMHPVDGDHAVCVARPDLFVPALLEACESVVRRTRRPRWRWPVRMPWRRGR